VQIGFIGGLGKMGGNMAGRVVAALRTAPKL
jgi:3-hydroxyisobutyrate dehydrogenase-like beta-hydroxyacid dehydrogenase